MTEWYKLLWNRLTEEYNIRVTSQYIGSVTGAFRFYPCKCGILTSLPLSLPLPLPLSFSLPLLSLSLSLSSLSHLPPLFSIRIHIIW